MLIKRTTIVVAIILSTLVACQTKSVGEIRTQMDEGVPATEEPAPKPQPVETEEFSNRLAFGDGSLIRQEDLLGDVVNIEDGSPADDQAADIALVMLEFDAYTGTGPFRVKVNMADPNVVESEDFSFAGTIEFLREGQVIGSYRWQRHDGVEEAGMVDPTTGEILPSGAAPQLVERVNDGEPRAVLELKLPQEEIPQGFDEVRIRTYHMASPDSARVGDALDIFIEPFEVKS